MNFPAERREVLSICLQLADKGYLAGTGGNVALRAGNDHLAITPSASDYYAMRPEDICIVRLDDLTCVYGARRPSVELRLHANIFRKRPDCTASIHTHQPIASAYSLLAIDLLPHHPDHQRLLGEVVPCLSYAPSGTNWLAGNLLKRLSATTHAWIMRNHGVIACGATAKIAIDRLEALESSCSRYFCQSIHKRNAIAYSPELSSVLELLSYSHDPEF